MLSMGLKKFSAAGGEFIVGTEMVNGLQVRVPTESHGGVAD